MMQPKRTKFRKAHKGRIHGKAKGGSALNFGAFGLNSDFDDEKAELEWMTELAKETGRPVWFLLTDRATDPQRWRRLIKGVHDARAQGANLTAQIAGRPVIVEPSSRRVVQIIE